LLVTTNTGGIGGAGVTGADGAGSRGSRQRRGGTGAVGAEPHRDGVGRGTGRRRDAGSRDRSGRRRAGGRQGRGIVDVDDLLWGREKNLQRGTGRRENRTEVARRGVRSGPGLGSGMKKPTRFKRQFHVLYYSNGM